MSKKRISALIIVSLFFVMTIGCFNSESTIIEKPGEIIIPPDMSISLGWSYTTDNYGIQSSPQAADIDQDGEIEVVIGGSDNYTYCLDSTGALEWRYLSSDNIYTCTPTLADLDQDGYFEILIGGFD
ncbi:MAG: VCBS repeat-containing protein, partial [Asgard group archaeon]|nr:VCBS repeat-containing protein [Asgard group archaeon]